MFGRICSFRCAPNYPNYTVPIQSNSAFKSINLHCYENASNHHTSRYFQLKQGNMVIRRGQPFKVTITLTADYRDEDQISFIFRCSDETPNSANGTLVTVPLMKKSESNYSWKATIEKVKGNAITVLITPSPFCIVGGWHLTVNYNGKTRTGSVKVMQNIFILFNPWCRKDEVFMDSKIWKDETVLNTHGLIWKNQPPSSGTVWNYAQYEQYVLECTIYCISKVARLSPSLRSSPIHVSRALSGAINAKDNNGVLQGSWGEYNGGVPPTMWTGSKAILQQYYRTKYPVRYGQCWVFAGILTSVCRAIGLPARTITNFQSAHDSNGSLAVEYVLGPYGYRNLDSIWNYHVWTEVWMKRPDIGKAYDGWQVIDATPQERSNTGAFQCGPASVVAIRYGEIRKPYDVGFIFSEVNADVVYWSGNRIVGVNSRRVGQLISTKAPGCFMRMDITSNYKFKKNSKEEKAAYLKALTARESYNPWSRMYLNTKFSDVKFKLDYNNDVLVGENFSISLNIFNRNKYKGHNITTMLCLDAYTRQGRYLSNVKTKKGLVELKPGSSVRYQLDVYYKDYESYIGENVIFIISSVGIIKHTNSNYFDRNIFRIVNPDVKITLYYSNKELYGSVSIKNPLPRKLHGKYFLVDAPGVDEIMKVNAEKSVLPGDALVESFKLPKLNPGNYIVAAKFISRQLDDIDGFDYFIIK